MSVKEVVATVAKVATQVLHPFTTTTYEAFPVATCDISSRNGRNRGVARSESCGCKVATARISRNAYPAVKKRLTPPVATFATELKVVRNSRSADRLRAEWRSDR